ncbi:MAG: cell division protein ZapA [Aestuariivita sp.]|jgi:cell division protein ZapA (FtsZ GTPase activity inhibitor)|nr:cell division protein ZapA [Aestuariivita sp.]
MGIPGQFSVTFNTLRTKIVNTNIPYFFQVSDLPRFVELDEFQLDHLERLEGISTPDELSAEISRYNEALAKQNRQGKTGSSESEIQIGGRTFSVAHQEGEAEYLIAAAKMLDAEATVLSKEVGRMPEARMLLMAGLMLADKTAALEEKVRELEEKLAAKNQNSI